MQSPAADYNRNCKPNICFIHLFYLEVIWTMKQNKGRQQYEEVKQSVLDRKKRLASNQYKFS